MTTKQQRETQEYFEAHTREWEGAKSVDAQKKVNIIKQRNDFVQKVVRERKKTETALDIGCGTGDLVCALAEQGIAATGIDFATEMVAAANAKAEKRQNKNARFVCASIFDVPLKPDSYDVISANGFIEYISYEELDRLITLVQKALRKNGSVVIGSRNRLFNLFSLNDFTREEIENGAAPALLREAIDIVSVSSPTEIATIKAAPFQKAGVERQEAGVKVSTRYQFTPTQLAGLLAKNGLKLIEIFPIHIHGVPLRFKEKYLSVHTAISDLLQTYAEKDALSFVPYASSFMLHAKK